MAEKKDIPQGMVELSEKSQKRIQRFKIFDEFYTKARAIFEPYKAIGEREQYFQALYMLYVVPGSRMGAHESNIVDMFWGTRPFDKEEGVEDGRKRIKLKSESGVTMFFHKNDDGYVTIQLYPAHTENSHPIEDFIFWKLRINPSKLHKNWFQKRCWKAFMAYMEVTSIDGDPSIWQRIHIWFLRNFKHIIIDKKQVPVRAWTLIRKVGTWILTVAFSGLAIFLLQIWLQPNPAEHENIKSIKEATERTEILMDSVNQ